MKKVLLILLLLVSAAQFVAAQTTIRVFDTVLFYDGYAGVVNNPIPQPGVIRHRNDLYARKLSTAELQSIGSTLTMKVTVNAACDNYDRIGNVNMALVPKGATTYKPDSVQRIELGRYITPFMNKNASSNMVPYTYSINNVAHLLKETSITINYDIWIELELFGVPYAAQTQIAGCSGRNDVFYGSLDFITNTPSAPTESTNILVPLSFKQNLNNYNASGTDTIGKTTKTITFTVPNNLSDASLYLITSNHGSNTGGEEYNRREHFAYFDGNLKLTYTPGRPTCEPFRQYNTQGNGIYGASPRDSANWQSFSNWCPGDAIDTRWIGLGALTAGTHKFMIRVPDAMFAGGQGYFPFSLYLQGKTSGTLGTASIYNTAGSLHIYPNPAGNFVIVDAGDELVEHVSLIDMVGGTVYNNEQPGKVSVAINTTQFSAGIYTLQVRTARGTTMRKLQVVH